jgi:hypothetical protein
MAGKIKETRSKKIAAYSQISYVVDPDPVALYYQPLLRKKGIEEIVFHVCPFIVF